MKTFSFVTLLASLVLFAGSCKKNKSTTSTSSCSTAIYGYLRTGDTNTIGPYAPAMFGVLNPATAASTTLATINATSHANQGAYNTADNCYYALSDSARRPILYKITGGGIVSTYRLPTDEVCRLTALVYNGFSNRLMAIKQDNVDTVIEILPDTTGHFGTSSIATFVSDNIRVMAMTADAATGAVYVAINNNISSTAPAISFNILKLANGTTAFTTPNATPNRWLFGLQYNADDHMLYGITTGNFLSLSATQFVKITPTGDATVLSNLPIAMYFDDFSTCLDRCNGRFILASSPGFFNNGADSSGLFQIDMSGNVVQSNKVQGRYGGLVVKE